MDERKHTALPWQDAADQICETMQDRVKKHARVAAEAIYADGKARPIESGTFPLAHGQSNRVGRLRAYGNAMHRAKITQFILASQEAIGDLT